MPRFHLTDTEARTYFTTSIVCAYVRNNAAPPRELPRLIASVHSAFERPPKRSPAEVRSSITPDALISLINGKSYAILKLHLASH